MNQELGQIFAQNADYTIYSMGNENTGIYYASIPNNLKSSLKIFVDLHKKDDFSMYKDIKDPLKRQELITKLTEVNKFINNMNKTGIYIMPNIDVTAIEKLDDHSRIEEYNRMFKMIASCTNDVSKALNSTANGKKTIEQAITIIAQTESDKHFIEWLKQQYPMYVVGITLDDLRKQYQLEQQLLNQPSNPEIVNMSAIDNKVVENTISSVQSNVNISNDQIISMAQKNIQNGNTIEQVKKPNNFVNQNTNQSLSNLNQEPIIQKTNGIAPVDHSLDEIAYQQKKQSSPTLVKTPNNKIGNIARAGFVKFPIFLLTIMAIGAFGIFVGKLFYTYLSQQ